MPQVLVLYHAPADPAAFERYYTEKHVPIAKRLPNLRSYTISKGPIQALTGTAPHLIARLEFDSMSDIQAALMSSAGQATAGDLANFATGGATILICDDQQV